VVKAVVALALAGCSFTTMQTPHGSPPECTESTAAPIVDALLAVASPFVVYWAVSSNHDSQQNNDPRLRTMFDVMVTGIVSTPVVALYGASSVYGFLKTGRCARAKRAYGQYQQLVNVPRVPGSYAPAPSPPNSAPPPMVPAPPPGPMTQPAPAQ
jgi:hypothetical protein